MPSNLSRVTKGQEIRRGREKEHNRLYYYLEIAQTLKDNQIKRNQKRKQKRKREEELARGPVPDEIFQVQGKPDWNLQFRNEAPVPY
jgi:hypothetical protein